MQRTPKSIAEVLYLKRKAKYIAKNRNVPHHEALDLAAQSFGFSNWKHFLKSKNITEVTDERINF